MDASEQDKMQRMQQNLATIRKVAGWTSQRLADEIGITRQTVSNLEHGRTPLTKTQYIALRYVFNLEVASTENQALAKVISALVDDPIDDEDDALETMGSLSRTTSLLAADVEDEGKKLSFVSFFKKCVLPGMVHGAALGVALPSALFLAPGTAAMAMATAVYEAKRREASSQTDEASQAEDDLD